MSATQTHIFYIVKAQTHLRNNKWICRQLKNNLVPDYSLEIDNGCYCKIEIIAPPADYRVSSDYRVCVGLKVFFYFFPSVDVIKSFICRRFTYKTVVLVVWTNLLLIQGPKKFTAIIASLTLEA
jgi:hypothetical protein